MAKRSQQVKIITLTGLALVVIGLLKSKASTMKFSYFAAPVASKLQRISTALLAAGLTPFQLKLALAQILHETGQFSSRSNVARLNNNYSGIKYINKPYQNAVKGSPVPQRERSAKDLPTNYYAKFASIEDWAKDYLRILNRKAKPLEASTIADFNNRLAKNGYYDTNIPGAIDNYLHGLKYFFVKLV